MKNIDCVVIPLKWVWKRYEPICRLSIYWLFIILIPGVSCNSSRNTFIDQEVFIPVKANSLYLRLAGNKNGPIVLLLHGGPGGCSGFDRYFYKDVLEEDYLLGYLDQRGCGKSPRESADSLITMEQFVADLDAVVDTLKQRFANRPIHLLGGSWGGTLGFLYLLDHQQKIQSFVSVSGKISGPYQNKVLLDHEKALANSELNVLGGHESARSDSLHYVLREINRIEKGNFNQFFEDMELIKFTFPEILGFDPYWCDTAAHNRIMKLGKDSVFYQLAHYDLESYDSVAEKGAYVNKIFRNTPAYNHLELNNLLASIHIPVAVIGGAEDYAVGPGQAKLIYDCLSGVPNDKKQLHVLPGAAHNVNVEVPELYYPIVQKFLDKHD
ncbi:Pimeloyl-ACP methyl ester carboxylesterase [Arachidicoccus rhizosphaerae]|uniref:Pimeloyl-ACP methyl ester carboxylesterase n=1 Tax=Arachidicoccus rhizosphaerae TaxID=551991 RepID=A0A1H3ZUE4_9BACT|nr:alpha/beta hydrolase [Arachidicoccus rhizosphaerae]SEA27308.1 Pimeloyl-ACP methyl ester carboxylesterase [Arachidicoccus rhizosphaerae]